MRCYPFVAVYESRFNRQQRRHIVSEKSSIVCVVLAATRSGIQWPHSKLEIGSVAKGKPRANPPLQAKLQLSSKVQGPVRGFWKEKVPLRPPFGRSRRVFLLPFSALVGWFRFSVLPSLHSLATHEEKPQKVRRPLWQRSSSRYHPFGGAIRRPGSANWRRNSRLQASQWTARVLTIPLSVLTRRPLD